ncbi:MAG: cytochrome c peroxidase [Bacteroidota bacterium]|nr:cytochrome c peroxidase [Bacteroidota bacterium]
MEKNKFNVLLTILGVLLSTIFLLSSCNDNGDEPNPEPTGPTAYEFPTPAYFPTNLNIPDDNPTTVEGVKLGRYLYYDGRIAGRTDCDSMISCSKCHVQEKGFVSSDPNGKGIGVMGFGPGTTVMPHVNFLYRIPSHFGWNGSVSSIEEDATAVFLLENEFATTHERAIKMLESIDIYPPMFKAAFGTEEITIERISKAIAQFMRTLISYNSKFDKWLRHEIPSLSPAESRGFEFLMSEKADCFHCHGQFALLSTYEFSNNAKDSVFVGLDDRFSITGDPMDKGAFLTPTLRNVELRNSFMHDGRFKTLREVVDFYSEELVNSPYVDPLMEWIYYGGTHLTELEKDDLIAFLKTLTDYEFISNPNFSKPADLDTGCK